MSLDPVEPDGARMERSFSEFPEEMGQLKAAFPDLSAMDLARFLSATEYDLQSVSMNLWIIENMWLVQTDVVSHLYIYIYDEDKKHCGILVSGHGASGAACRVAEVYARG